MESMADILADTKRYLAEARQTLAALKGGAKLSSSLAQEDAIKILEEKIAMYEATLRRYGGRE